MYYSLYIILLYYIIISCTRDFMNDEFQILGQVTSTGVSCLLSSFF
jgi:hypothetical protein